LPEQLLNLLKLCLLALLYLFFLRVARAVWVEVGGPRPRRGRRAVPEGNAAPVGEMPPPAVAPPVMPTAPTTPAMPKSPTVPKSPTGPTGPPSPALPAAAPRSSPQLVTIAPQEFAGRRYPLTGELTIGRASGCGVLLEDNYVSQLHARVFLQPDGAYVEDLGSTNGTYLLRDRDRHQERHKVAGPRLLERGDQVQVGSTVMELVA